MKYNFDKYTILLAAWTNKIARPNYYALVPYREVSRDDNEIDLGTYIDNIWTPNLTNKQIKNKDIKVIEDNLNKLRDYLLETALLKPIDTTSNLITD
jgi:hypothetical protein